MCSRIFPESLAPVRLATVLALGVSLYYYATQTLLVCPSLSTKSNMERLGSFVKQEPRHARHFGDARGEKPKAAPVALVLVVTRKSKNCPCKNTHATNESHTANKANCSLAMTDAYP